MTKLRQTIARRLKDAQNTAAMLTTFNEVDMTEVMAMRARYKDAFEKKHGAKLGFMGFFVKACVQALKDIPAVNAEIDGADLVYKNYYHLGIAVGTDKGLIVPVVRDCDKLSVAGIERAIADLGRRAREGQLKLEELQGGTFTITNGGIYGSLMSTPILNAPQSGILGMHKIQERPVVVAGKIEIRPMMYLALSYDHRDRRRQGGGDVPGARQGGARGSREAGAGFVMTGTPRRSKALRLRPATDPLSYNYLTLADKRNMVLAKKATTTVVSTKGQVILPKAIRDSKEWVAGSRSSSSKRRADGVLLSAARPFAPTKPEEVFGALSTSTASALSDRGHREGAARRCEAAAMLTIDTNIVIRFLTRDHEVACATGAYRSSATTTCSCL